MQGTTHEYKTPVLGDVAGGARHTTRHDFTHHSHDKLGSRTSTVLNEVACSI